MVTQDEIAAYDATYMNLPTRNAQNNMALYKCLMSSLSPEGKQKVSLVAEKYNRGNQPSGPLLLSVIINESQTDTNSTVMAIRQNLTKLNEYLPSVGHDIVKFS